jgi:exodeoxyribonuclease VII small subunit
MVSKESFNFTKAYEELEKIVAAFESGDIDLERDLPKFERGLHLAQSCRQRLRELENHVRKIEKTFHVEEDLRAEREGQSGSAPRDGSLGDG